MSIILLIIGFLILLFLRLPVFIALAFPSIVYLLINDLSLNVVGYEFYGALNDFSLIAVPLFIFMGSLLTNFKFTDRVVEFVQIAYKNKKGYSLKMNAILSLLMSGMSGSSIADIGALGKLEVKAAEREGFKRSFGAAFTISTATVGPIFPPSIPLIIFAATASVSSIQSLLAGVLPAFLIIGLLYIFAVIKVNRSKENIGDTIIQEQYDTKIGFWESFLKTLPIILLIPIVVLSMLSGIFSPSEVGAAAVAYLILLSFFYKAFSIKTFISSVISSVISTTSIMILMAGGALFARILINEGLPQYLSTFLLGISENPIIILIAINIILLIVGMFMEGLTIIVLLTPLILPVTTAAGIDPIHLGIVMVFNVLVGMVTPPFGLNIFAIMDIVNVKLKDLLKELIPLYGILILALILLTLFPIISLFVPGLMFN